MTQDDSRDTPEPPGDGPPGYVPPGYPPPGTPAGASAGAPPGGPPPGGPPPGGPPPGGPPPGGPPPGGPPPGGPPPAAGPAAGQPTPDRPPAGPGAQRRLTRSRRSRMIAGVAGGLGEYAGIDPVLFRVLFAVLALPIFGWVGLLLYLLGWLLLPDDGEESSPAESLLGRGGRAAGTSVEGVLLGVGAALLAILLVRGDIGDGGDVVLLLLLVIGGTLLMRKIERRRGRTGALAGFSPGGPPPAYPTAPYPPAYSPYTGYGQPAAGAAGAEQLTAPLAAVGAPTAPLPGVGTPAPPYGYAGSPPPPPPPSRPARPREPSVLGRLTLSAMAIALGVLGVLDAARGYDLTARHYLALALAVLGAGLLVGTVVGRARWLVWLGVLVSVALIASSTAEVVFRGGAGDREFRPTSVSAVADRYEVGAGTMTIDLSQVDFTDRDVRTDVRAGVGDIRIAVPPEVDVTIRAHAGAGDLTLLGVHYEGLQVSQTITDDGPDGAGGGALELVVNVGLGEVEVFRA